MRRLLWVAALGIATAAHAQEDAPSRLARLEQQALELENGLAQVSPAKENQADLAERRLIRAQVLYGVGHYDDAAVLLYDIVEKHQATRSYPDALFFLADSLYKKGDNLLARDYFHKVIDTLGESSPHYGEALGRLVELVVRTKDPSRIQDYLARLDRLPAGKGLESVPYVRGKYAYSAGRHDEALRFFESIPPTSSYALQAHYFIGVTHAAKGDLAAAAKAFQGVTREPTKTKDEETIVELARLALGRVFYERDQTQEAIDAYQAISRRSPAFGDALQEIAWAYVKAKQYDRALRALELLQLASPKASDLPEIRLLEGNLRLRKAQGIGADGLGNTAEEYSKATKVFEQMRGTYEKSKDDIDKLLAAHADRRAYFNALTGKGGEALDVQVEVPKPAMDAVKEDPEAGRVLGVTKTLDEVRAELGDAAKGIARLERAVASPSRVRIFPELASRRARAEEILEGLTRVRTALGNEERVLVLGSLSPGEQAELQRVQTLREGLARKIAALPNSGDAYEERQRKAREAVQDIDKRATEVEVFLYSLEAQMVALERYYATQPGQKMSPAEFERERKPIRDAIDALRAQLDAFHHDTELAADEAGIGDELAVEDQDLRKQLRAAVKSEHDILARAASRASGDSAARVREIEAELARADNVDKAIARVNGRVDEAVEGQLREVKVAIAEEKAELVGYRQQLVSYDGETVDVGSDAVAGAFGRVARKFKDFVVRSDVGLLDVTWAQHEQSQKYADRLRIDFAREKNTLDAEFRDVLQDKPAEPPKPEEKPSGGRP